MKTLESLIDYDAHIDLLSLDDIFEDIKNLVIDSIRYAKDFAKDSAKAILMALVLSPMQAKAYNVIYSQPIEIVVNTGGEMPDIVDVKDEFPQLHRMHDRIRELSQLKENWDNAGGMPVSSEALMLAGNFIDLLSEEVLSHCSIFPAANSWIYIQGKFAKGSLMVTISNESITYILKGKGIDGMSASRVAIYHNTVRKIDRTISDYLLS